MAKIDFSLIEGFDEMSADDKLAAIQNLEIPDRSDEIEKLKADAKKSKELIDKYSSEISSLKKENAAGLSEAERKEKEKEDALIDLQNKYDALLKSSAIETHTAKGVALGCDEDLAAKIAQSFADCDAEVFYSGLAEFKQAIEKSVKAELVKSTPKPDSKGTASKALSKDDIFKIKDPSERQRLIAENLELFTKEN